VLAESATLAEATPQLLQVICESLRWKMGEFWRVDDSINLLRCVETWHVPGLEVTAFIEASRQTELAPDAGLPGRVWQSGQPAWVSDVTTDPGFARAAIASNLGLRGAAAFPILLGNHTLGLMLFFSRRTPEVDEDLLKIMSAIGSQIGQFTERKRAEESLRKQNEYLAALHETALGLINRLDLDDLLEVLVKRACALVDIPSGYVYLVEPGGTEMSVKVGVGVSRDFVGARISKGQGVAGRIWQTGQPLVVDDYRNWEHRLTDAGYDVLRLVGAVPLRSGSRVVGVLGVESTEDGQGLGQHQIEILNRFAQLASIALDNAQLHSAVQQELAERKRAGEALKRSESDYRHLFNKANDAVLIFESEGEIILEANAAACDIYGYSRDELIGMSLKRLTKSVLAGESQIKELLDAGTFSNFESIHFNNKGEEIYFLINSSVIDYQDRRAILSINHNITERKRAEEKVQSLARFPSENPNPVLRLGRDGMILHANSASRLLLQDWGCAVGDRAPLFWQQEASAALASQTNKTIDVVCGDITFSIFVAPIVEADYVNLYGLDITARKRSEEALRESEERYRDLVENSQEFICTHDLDGLILSGNRAAVEVMGYDPKDYYKRNLRELLVPEVRDQFDDYLTRIRRDGVASGLMLVQTSSGERRVWEYHNTVRTEGVAAPIVRSMARDITEQRRAEKALHESEERYRELFENAKDAIYVHDLSGRYTSVNRAAEQLSGFTREEILGKHYSNFVLPRDLKHVRTNLCRKLDLENETIYEVDMVTRTGRRVPVEVSSRLILENGVAVGVQGVARDITDRKRAQEALRTYSQRLIEAQEAERQNIARELHDQIGQVLTAVKINLQSVQHSCRTAECVPRLDESIGIVDEALGRVRELSIELRPSLLDDLGLTAALRWYVDHFAQRTGIIAEVLNGLEEDSRLPRELETVCFRIAQEALTNVARHARAASVSVQLERSRETMLLTIIDDGVGFDVDKLRKSASAASALGLRGMEERALAVGGYIEIDSGLERGTRIRATLPLRGK
jgi:PAS domain S-box-containing protein